MKERSKNKENVLSCYVSCHFVYNLTIFDINSINKFIEIQYNFSLACRGKGNTSAHLAAASWSNTQLELPYVYSYDDGGSFSPLEEKF
jgi:hypothetical protein